MMLSTLVKPEHFCGPDVDISGLSADSRTIGPGDVFAALPGAQIDGRNFIESALESGASAILSTPGLAKLPVAYIASDKPRQTYAQMAAKLYPGQPETLVAVTGTNGKSSTIEFLRQIWSASGHKAACFGTLGVRTDTGLTPLTHTTPDAVSLHKILAKLKRDGFESAAMEASSHGLKQYRLDGVRLSATGFTNLSQDHFDYHQTMDDYFNAKARLFSELAEPGSPAVINVDSDAGKKMAKIAQQAGLRLISVGWSGADIRIEKITPTQNAQITDISIGGSRHRLDIPLVGEFQVLNVISAIGLAMATGVAQDIALDAAQSLVGVAGRMETVGHASNGAPVIVDFAHSPDGLEKLLLALRPHTHNRLFVVFGAGGDRDPDKRPKMGAIAARLADYVIVTDDNPRTENPASIRDAVKVGCPDADNIGDRKAAIAKAVSLLEPGDSLVIAGKGHESGQVIGTKTYPFNDADVVREILS